MRCGVSDWSSRSRCGLSFLWVRVHPPKDLDTFEGWTARAFGWRLYRKFFKAYTEKVWGIPAAEIKADWAAQRIKSLTLGNVIKNALAPSRNKARITSLIEEFHYPRLGPGMMWERARELVEDQGSQGGAGHPARVDPPFAAGGR